MDSQDAKWVEIHPKRGPKPIKGTGKATSKTNLDKNMSKLLCIDKEIKFSMNSLMNLLSEGKEMALSGKGEKRIGPPTNPLGCQINLLSYS